MTKHVVNVSGGKDSTALLLLACEYAEKKGIEIIPVMADTGNEHPHVYDYIGYLEQRLGLPITIVKQDFTRRFEIRRENIQRDWPKIGMSAEKIARALELMQPSGSPFLDLCLLKGRFPSTRARFCTQELKIFPVRDQIVRPLLADDETVLRWVGVRRDESQTRATAKRWEIDPDHPNDPSWIWRPLLDWSVDDVFALHRKHGIEANPLYFEGCGRVGCMPCIHASKAELANISARWPEHFDKIAEWERLVAEASKRGAASFFAADKTPGAHINNHNLPIPQAHDVMEWSQTSRGGRQFDLITALHQQEPPICSSFYGLCE